MWEELKNLRANYLDSAWCVAGDFNSVRSTSERRGVSVQPASRDMEGFNEFICDMGLIDLPLVGRKFTWHRANGSCMSRLDKFLLSEE